MYELKNGDGQLTAEVKCVNEGWTFVVIAEVACICTCTCMGVYTHCDSRRKLMESSAARLALPPSRNATSRQETTRECSTSGAYKRCALAFVASFA